LQPILAELEQTEYAPIPFIDGDLLTEKGLTPGPIFKRILEAAYDAQLEGRLHNREDAIEFAMQLSREKGRE
jgi:poly(A) polymerase